MYCCDALIIPQYHLWYEMSCVVVVNILKQQLGIIKAI